MQRNCILYRLVVTSVTHPTFQELGRGWYHTHTLIVDMTLVLLLRHLVSLIQHVGGRMVMSIWQRVMLRVVMWSHFGSRLTRLQVMRFWYSVHCFMIALHRLKYGCILSLLRERTEIFSHAVKNRIFWDCLKRQSYLLLYGALL